MTSAEDVPAEDGRIPLAEAPRRRIRDTRLEPAIDAELSWGNPVVRDFARDPKLASGSMTFAHPVHVAELLDTFRFPPDTGPAEILGQTTLSDGRDWTVVVGGLRPGFRLVPGDRRNRAEPIPGYQEPVRTPRRPPVVSEPSWRGRSGVHGALLGWPAGPLVQLYVWRDDTGRPVVETVGDTGFVVATSAKPAGVELAAAATYVDDLDTVLDVVPVGFGVLIDRDTPARRAVRPGQLAALRPHEAPAPGDQRVHFSPVPDFLLDEVRRIGRTVEAHGLRAQVIWASTPDAAGLWVEATRKGDSDRVWVAVREAQPWPATRYVTRAEHSSPWGSVPRVEQRSPLADLPDERLRPGPVGRSRPPPGCLPVLAFLVLLVVVMFVVVLVQAIV